ncbi:MAG: hypothetical protein D6798_11990 [Deltaproteobacteria bacterium]|nr:MAG: hypothetical protein D6798_11990 [Deltaproteobacteria bacterium]
MTMSLPELRLAPEYQCHPLWVEGTDGIRNVDTAALHLPADLAADIDRWAARYQEGYDPTDPLASGFADPGEEAAWDEEGRALWRRLRDQLGDRYRVRYFSPRAGWLEPDAPDADPTTAGAAAGGDPVMALLSSPRARDRLEGLKRLEQQGGPVEAALPLLDDDAPYLFAHAGRGYIAEVRADALVTVQTLYRLAGRRPDFGPVTVRKAMPQDDAFSQAASIVQALPPEQREALRARVDAHLAARVRPEPFETPACRAYCTLQLLGRIRYERQEVDPVTLLTPLQAEVAASQVRSDRPRPHLRFGTADRPLGWFYRQDGRWVEDLAETPEAPRIRRFLRSFTTSDHGELPRVVGAAEGAPRHNPDGSLVLDGTVPRDVADPAEYLASLAAFLDGLVPCELVR